ncbi:hypothetical protein ACTOB_002408 [Actinoplanes oblitus]|uniref:Uncharacterized protein n=1 Tax=Actinoplanes oblitus TaxID=3040509 RepID=A0ABY8WLQ2_9ACTN|nr:hypothetical protein [Actinoplanes oblitus]WIM98794.1 hypothetical protein ACTOB_002408 [Actinoplanes oblitus]
MPESQFNFGDMNFNGGQQIFGNENTVSQTNYIELSPREQVESRLTTIRSEHPDPALAERQIAEIEQGLNDPTPENRTRLERALTRLAETTGDARTAAEAIAAISVIVAANWPF